MAVRESLSVFHLYPITLGTLFHFHWISVGWATCCAATGAAGGSSSVVAEISVTGEVPQEPTAQMYRVYNVLQVNPDSVKVVSVVNVAAIESLSVCHL